MLINTKQSREDDLIIAKWCEPRPTEPPERAYELRDFWFWAIIRASWQPRYFSNNALTMLNVFKLVESRGLRDRLTVWVMAPLDQQIAAIVQLIESEV